MKNENKRLKPSEEKVWLNTFPEGASDTPLPKMKVNDYFTKINSNHLDEIGIISTLGPKYSWGEIKENYEKTSKSLLSMGLKPGDNIAVCLLNVPEIVSTILACSKLGLTINMIDPLANPVDVINRIRMKNAKVLIAQDKVSPLFAAIKNHINVEYIITTPIFNGVTNAGMKPLDKNVGWWDNFIENGRYNTDKTDVVYDAKMPFIYTHSSGSTGVTKPIELGHDTFTHTAYMHSVAGMEFSRGNKMLATIPALFSTGVNPSVMLGILLGMTVILEANYERQTFLNNIKTYLPQYAIATKYFWKGMSEDPDFEKIDLSFFIYPTICGEKVRKHEIRRLNEFGKKRNFNRGWSNGYGQCEFGGGIGTSANKLNNKDINTIGNPYTHNLILVVDPETGEELDYNERGAIVVKDCTTVMFGYPDMPELTEEFFRNGVANTGDIGYVNERGNFFVDGRLSDYIQISEDMVLYPYEIEDIIEDIMESDQLFELAINDYGIHGIPNGDYYIPMLQIVLSKGCEVEKEFILSTINEAINNRLSSHKRIAAYKLRTEAFPSTAAGKTDLSQCKNETDGFVTVNEDKQLEPYILVKKQ